MIRQIVLWGSEVLEHPSEPVTNITDAEIKLVQDMIETMYKAPGVGLAAPQVGVAKRIMVTDTTSGEIPRLLRPKENNSKKRAASAFLGSLRQWCALRNSFCRALTSREKRSPLKPKTCLRAPSVTKWTTWTESCSSTTSASSNAT
jgi:hypothetical protein